MPEIATSQAIVIGADSLVGSALISALRRTGVSVRGTTRRKDRASQENMFYLDLAATLPEALPRANVAFICAAMTKLSICRSMPGLAERINYIAPVELAKRFLAINTRVVFVSTAAVLDCSEPRMQANRPRAGRSLYGRWKGDAEQAILDLSENTSVVRLTKILPPDHSLFCGWIKVLRDSKKIEAFDDHRIAPILVSDAVEALVAVGERGSGLYQISGSCDVSYFHIARYFASFLNISADQVHAQSSFDAGIPTDEIFSFTSLDCKRATELYGFTPPEPYRLLHDLFLRRLRTRDL